MACRRLRRRSLLSSADGTNARSEVPAHGEADSTGGVRHSIGAFARGGEGHVYLAGDRERRTAVSLNERSHRVVLIVERHSPVVWTVIVSVSAVSDCELAIRTCSSLNHGPLGRPLRLPGRAPRRSPQYQPARVAGWSPKTGRNFATPALAGVLPWRTAVRRNHDPEAMYPPPRFRDRVWSVPWQRRTSVLRLRPMRILPDEPDGPDEERWASAVGQRGGPARG